MAWMGSILLCYFALHPLPSKPHAKIVAQSHLSSWVHFGHLEELFVLGTLHFFLSAQHLVESPESIEFGANMRGLEMAQTSATNCLGS